MTRSEDVAARFGCTAEQVRAQYAKNAKSLRVMESKAREIAPKLYRGYTVAELTARAEAFEIMARGHE